METPEENDTIEVSYYDNNIEQAKIRIATGGRIGGYVNINTGLYFYWRYPGETDWRR